MSRAILAAYVVLATMMVLCTGIIVGLAALIAGADAETARIIVGCASVVIGAAFALLHGKLGA